MQPFHSTNKKEKKKKLVKYSIPEALHVFNLKFHTGEHHSLCSSLIFRTTPRYSFDKSGSKNFYRTQLSLMSCTQHTHDGIKLNILLK